MNLVKNISRLPGIGEKTAERLTMHIIRSPLKEVEQLSLSILETRKKIRSCSICFGLSDSDICNIFITLYHIYIITITMHLNFNILFGKFFQGTLCQICSKSRMFFWKNIKEFIPCNFKIIIRIIRRGAARFFMLR